jgi:carbonic anhydrase
MYRFRVAALAHLRHVGAPEMRTPIRNISEVKDRAAMQKLIEGIHQFQETVFSPRRAHFERLKDGQSPETLFITCSDSRIDPNLLTQSEPGELFILRNAGNIIPPYSPSHLGGEAPSIEYAVAALHVRDIIVCGHSHCGAMKALLDPTMVAELPLVASWLAQAETTRRLVQMYQRDVLEKNGDKSERLSPEESAELLNVTVQQNVLVQLENLRTHPAVAAALAQGKLQLHGWIYRIETGGVDVYDPQESRFISLAATPRANTPALAGVRG